MTSPNNGDDEIDDASLQSMRAVWLSMRDEDPPSTGMSALMAAAATKADEMRAKPSWLAQALTFLRRPPALAFATVMVLIGGAVLVTRKTADEKVDAMTASESNGELRYREQAQSNKNERPMIATESGADASTAPAAAEEPPLLPATRPELAVKPETKVRSHQPRNAGGKPQAPDTHLKQDGDTFGAGLEDKKPAKEATADPIPEPPKEPTKDARLDRGSTTKIEPGLTRGPTSVEPSQPPIQPPPEPGEAVILSEPETQPRTPALEQLARQAESAASRSDCVAVRSIVAQIKKQNEGFYKTRLGKNAAVAKCL